GSETEGAILRFQRTHLGRGDGRIEPGGKTLARLNAIAAAPPRTIGSARAASTASPMTAALEAARLARGRAGNARGPVEQPPEIAETARLAAVDVTFHLDR